MKKTNKPKQIEQIEPWYRLVSPLTGLKERGGDGFIIEGRSQILYNPLRNENINISAPIFYQGEKFEINRGGYVGNGDKVCCSGRLVDKGLFVDTNIFYLSKDYITNLFRNFYFGDKDGKLNGPFENSESFCRIRYDNLTRNTKSYYSVFRGLPEDYFLLSTLKEQHWKYPNLIVIIDKENVKIAGRGDKDIESLEKMLIGNEKLKSFFEKCNPQLLMEIDKSKDILNSFGVK